MIVSFSRNFIFFKTRKTAGTTVEIALTPSCGPDDIVTPLLPDDELLRLKDGTVEARNYARDPAAEARIAEAVLARDAGRFAALHAEAAAAGGFFNHMSAAQVRRRLSPDFWNRAFRFTVERHPYEKIVSTVFWAHRDEPCPDLQAAFDRCAADRREDIDLYSIDGEIVVDEIIRHEFLERDLKRVADRLGFKLPPLATAKGFSRTDRRPAAEILSPTQKALIYKRHRRTFDLLGYEP